VVLAWAGERAVLEEEAIQEGLLSVEVLSKEEQPIIVVIVMIKEIHTILAFKER
jgi:hypothetical protein